MKKKTLELFRRIAKNAMRPVPKMTVSEWADEYRMLSAEGSSEPGRWQTGRAPYQKAIMDAFTENGIHKVVVKSCSQVGKSEILNNIIGRFACLAPAPIMMIQPTIEMAQDFSKSRIAPMIRDTKALKAIFHEVKAREGGNTILSKLFPGGRLIMGGANSPAGLASRPIKILLCDEVDRFPTSAGTEGDPIDLASKRMTTFWDRVMGLFSTPTNVGESRIEDEYLEGTQEEWQHECPNCHEYHTLSYMDINTDYTQSVDAKGRKHVTVKAVSWRCPDCGFEFSEAVMRQQPQGYRAQNPDARVKGVRSFFTNCFASPWTNWAQVMQEWLEAKGDPDREKVVVNTRFGEAYENKGYFEGAEKIMQRRESYNAELPQGVLVLTAAVDVQDNRLEYEVCGWGAGEECWGIRKATIMGAPDNRRVWDELDQQLDRVYYFADGSGLNVTQTFIDSGGHYTQEVYAYCLNRGDRRRFAIKGSSAPGVSLIHKYTKQPIPGTHRTLPLVMLGVDSGKQYVFDRLGVTEAGPKYMHFPKDAERGYDEVYFKGLISEQRVARKKNGRIAWVWENIAKDRRNEPLDLRVYNLACVQQLNPDYDALRRALTGEPAATAKPKPQPHRSGLIRRMNFS